MVAVFFVGIGAVIDRDRVRADAAAGRHRAVLHRHVRRDLSSGRARHRHAALEEHRHAARGERRVGQSRRRQRGAHHRLFHRPRRLARGLHRAGHLLRRGRRALRRAPVDADRAPASRSAREGQPPADRMAPDYKALLLRVSAIVFVTTAVSSLIFQSTTFALAQGVRRAAAGHRAGRHAVAVGDRIAGTGRHRDRARRFHLRGVRDRLAGAACRRRLLDRLRAALRFSSSPPRSRSCSSR